MQAPNDLFNIMWRNIVFDWIKLCFQYFRSGVQSTEIIATDNEPVESNFLKWLQLINIFTIANSFF